jgi:hypothetical protein
MKTRNIIELSEQELSDCFGGSELSDHILYLIGRGLRCIANMSKDPANTKVLYPY